MGKLASVALLGAGMIAGYVASQLRPAPARAAEEAARASCAWGPELDAVRAAPKNHRILLENERVRVLDVTVQPREREPLHAHCNPSLLYVMQAGALRERDAAGKIVRDQKAPAAALPLTQWHQMEPPHSVENLDSKPVRILRVELKDFPAS